MNRGGIFFGVNLQNFLQKEINVGERSKFLYKKGQIAN